MFPSISRGCRERGVPIILLLLCMQVQKNSKNKAIIWKELNLEKIPYQLITISKEIRSWAKTRWQHPFEFFLLQGNRGKNQPSSWKLYLGIKFIFKISLKRDCLGHNNLARLSLTYPVWAFWCLYAIIRCSKSLPSGYVWESIIWGLNATKHPYLSLMAI